MCHSTFNIIIVHFVETRIHFFIIFYFILLLVLFRYQHLSDSHWRDFQCWRRDKRKKHTQNSNQIY